MSQAPGEHLILADFLPYRLSVLTNKVSRAFSKLYSRRFGLTIPEWRVMAVLGQQPDISADTVCTCTEMDKVTVSRAVARLLAKGHIERQFADEDRRRSILRLSPAGNAIYARIIPIARDYEAGLKEILAVEEWRHLDRLLDKLDRRAALLLNGTDRA